MNEQISNKEIELDFISNEFEKEFVSTHLVSTSTNLESKALKLKEFLNSA